MSGDVIMLKVTRSDCPASSRRPNNNEPKNIKQY